MPDLDLKKVRAYNNTTQSDVMLIQHYTEVTSLHIMLILHTRTREYCQPACPHILYKLNTACTYMTSLADGRTRAFVTRVS